MDPAARPLPHDPGKSEPPPPDPVIEAYKRDLDRTLLRANLRLSVEERLLRLMDLQRFAEELRDAGRRARERSRAEPA